MIAAHAIKRADTTSTCVAPSCSWPAWFDIEDTEGAPLLGTYCIEHAAKKLKDLNGET